MCKAASASGLYDFGVAVGKSSDHLEILGHDIKQPKSKADVSTCCSLLCTEQKGRNTNEKTGSTLLNVRFMFSNMQHVEELIRKMQVSQILKDSAHKQTFVTLTWKQHLDKGGPEEKLFQSKGGSVRNTCSSTSVSQIKTS